MGKVLINLESKYSRPIFNCMIQGNKIKVLLDTGATVPVWVKSEETLIELSKGNVIKDITFGGFGGDVTGCNAYVTDIELKGLTFLNVPIIASKLPNTEFELVLPASLFKNMIYMIDKRNNKFKVKFWGIKDKRITYRISENKKLMILLNDCDDLELLSTNGEKIETDDDILDEIFNTYDSE